FSNCSGRVATIPEPNGDPDRTYQIAAAKFYAGKIDEAQHDFEAIALDAKNPWKPAAPYLIARCHLRKKAYAEAAQQLDREIADPALSSWHGRARRLAGFARRKAAPGERLHELAEAITRKDAPSLAQDIYDYHYLLDLNVTPDRDDDITAWILNFQSRNASEAI